MSPWGRGQVGLATAAKAKPGHTFRPSDSSARNLPYRRNLTWRGDTCTGDSVQRLCSTLRSSLSVSYSLCLNTQWSVQAKGCSATTRKSEKALDMMMQTYPRCIVERAEPGARRWRVHSCGSWRVEKPMGAHGVALGSFHIRFSPSSWGDLGGWEPEVGEGSILTVYLCSF